MRVAVVIPAFNVADFVGKAIASVLAQTHHDWSLVVVDDGSTDQTLDVAASFSDPRIHVLHQSNAGVSAARNRGIAEACGDAFLFLDGDDWLAPTALSTLTDTLQNSPWAVAACGRYNRVGLDSRHHSCGRPANGDILEALLTRNLFVNGGHVLIAADALREAGGYNVDLRYGEDWELWTRLAQLGEFAAVPTAQPLLFVRERERSATFHRAAEINCNDQVLNLIYANEGLQSRIGRKRLIQLRQLAQAETAWAVGTSLLKKGLHREACHFLVQSVVSRPTPKRLCLLAMFATGMRTVRGTAQHSNGGSAAGVLASSRANPEHLLTH